MLETLGIVQSCHIQDVSRSKFARRLGGKSVLEWIVRRASECQRLDGIVVVLADNPEGERLAELVPSDVPVVLGSQHDPLARVTAALAQFPAHAAVKINVGFPFIDPALIDRLVNTAVAHPASDYISYCARNGRPAILSPVGVFGEWFRAKALQKAERDAKLAADREQITRYLYTHPEKFNLRLIPTPAELDRDDLRLSIDSEEDWELASTILDALGPEQLEWQKIAGLLDHQPELRERMAELNRAGI
ncbi:MAG TPA: NTP transferase domain-containing protein [Pirellulales bacterium]|jgi:spore coat polysaccharide biosynthesis protein SpsF|nr:NTP transferase domain-containing protein [Pirellulales bacterium]